MNPDEFRVAPPASAETDDEQRIRAITALRECLNGLASSGVDLTYAINALAMNLGVLIAQLPQNYRGPTVLKAGEVVTSIIEAQEKAGRAGGARMYEEGAKPN